MYSCLCFFIHIFKYNLFSSYNVCYTYAFLANCLALANLSVLIHGEDYFMLPAFLCCHSLYVKLRPPELSSVYFSILVGIVFVQTKIEQSFWKYF